MRHKLPLPGLCLFALLGVPASGPRAEEEPPGPPIESTRTTLTKWVETQQAIAKERRDWEEGREVLDARIELLEREIAGIEEQIAETRKAIAEADAKRRETLADAATLGDARELLEDSAADLERRTTSLLASLPDPIRERVKPLAQRIPSDPASIKLTLGQRFQNLVGILNEVNKFNREITVTSELRELSNGTSAEVKSLYLGLSQAYYVTADGEAAGTGRPTPSGWVWSAANEIAADVARAIAILQNEQVPAFVPLPVEVQ